MQSKESLSDARSLADLSDEELEKRLKNLKGKTRRVLKELANRMPIGKGKKDEAKKNA